ncbi:transglycosylase domain-containing protein [Streptomyces sp. ISL-100]|uniref:transglycosylase domain-containing protein n=1 Tax=Streptomyces sp. ISL-100 TaxID=2819173 RepID=UPI001BECBBC5|nr:transglycosylase domain-containing protein [Streptomyces sp. ISL-100]MBT2397566.1 penicillin-binding protein [Streptomyces sp. ISL-100]
MSEHRRKPSQPQDGGRAAARRAAQQPSGRRAAPTRDTSSTTEMLSGSYGEERPPGGRAEARRAAQRGTAGGSRRRGAEPGGRAAGRGRGGPPAKERFINYPRSEKYGWRRFVPSWKLVSGTCLGFFAIMVAGMGVAFAWVDTPDAQKMAQAQNNVFYWDNGTQLAATGGDRNRQSVDIGQIPQSMQNAVIAAENASFKDDWGVDPMGIGRAIVNMAMGQETQGGSTITQQYVKNLYLDQDQTMKRKFTELIISLKVGTMEDKDDVLKGYLNTAYFGRDAYGIQAASQAYFGKDSEDLNASQSAFLAALLKGPNLFNPDGGLGDNATPDKNRERAEYRWAWILDREVEVGRMKQAEADKWKKAGFPTLKDSEQATGLGGQKGYLVETAKKYVMKQTKITPEKLALGGYRIYTTFNKDKVNAMEKAVNKTRKAFLDTKARPKKDKFVQFGSASVDVETGAIVALYGGEGWDKKHFTNNADTWGVPVGSTWKPYVLAAAMKHGTHNSGSEGLSPLSKYNGNDMIEIKYPSGNPVPGKNGQPFRQKNESDKAYGYVTLREAMEKSINTPFVQLGMDVGLDKVADMAEDTGILEESMDQRNASFSLGTSTPSAIRMASSYATFADSGMHREPYSVSKVLLNGQEQPGFEKPKRERAMDPEIADNITDVLRNVVESDEGTGKKAQKLGRPVAGKTGTTDKNKSAWFVGYTPQLSTSVTLFRTDPESRKLLSMNGTGGVPSIHGGDIPTEVWTNYMRDALKDEEVKDFPEALPIGKKADSAGAPTPKPSVTPSQTPSSTPSSTPSQTPSETPPTPSETPSETETCEPLDWACDNGENANGGNANGGTDAGGTDAGGTDTGGTDTGGTTDGTTTDGGTTDGTTTDGSTEGKPGNGSSNGGLFGGGG